MVVIDTTAAANIGNLVLSHRLPGAMGTEKFECAGTQD